MLKYEKQINGVSANVFHNKNSKKRNVNIKQHRKSNDMIGKTFHNAKPEKSTKELNFYVSVYSTSISEQHTKRVNK